MAGNVQIVGRSNGDRAQALALAVFEQARMGQPNDAGIRSGGDTMFGGILTREL